MQNEEEMLCHRWEDFFVVGVYAGSSMNPYRLKYSILCVEDYQDFAPQREELDCKAFIHYEKYGHALEWGIPSLENPLHPYMKIVEMAIAKFHLKITDRRRLSLDNSSLHVHSENHLKAVCDSCGQVVYRVSRYSPTNNCLRCIF